MRRHASGQALTGSGSITSSTTEAEEGNRDAGGWASRKVRGHARLAFPARRRCFRRAPWGLRRGGGRDKGGWRVGELPRAPALLGFHRSLAKAAAVAPDRAFAARRRARPSGCLSAGYLAPLGSLLLPKSLRASASSFCRKSFTSCNARSRSPITQASCPAGSASRGVGSGIATPIRQRPAC